MGALQNLAPDATDVAYQDVTNFLMTRWIHLTLIAFLAHFRLPAGPTSRECRMEEDFQVSVGPYNASAMQA